MIELKHIDKYYNIGTVNEVCLFKDFNLTVDDGDFISTNLVHIILGTLYQISSFEFDFTAVNIAVAIQKL